MAEDWTGIAAEVAAAIADIGFDVEIRRIADGRVTPYDTAEDVVEWWTVKAIEGKAWRGPTAASVAAGTGRTLLIGATAEFTPADGDIVRVRDQDHNILRAMPLAPGGVDLIYRLELQS